MKLDKIDDARILINKRDTLLDVLAKHETWKDGHFELVEHCGSSPNKIRISYFPELEEKIIELVREEIKTIEKQLKEL